MKVRNQLTVLFLCSIFSLNAQITTTKATKHPQHLSLQWFGLTIHPNGGSVFMRENYPLRLDAKAIFVVNVGVAASHDIDLSKRFFLRSQAGFLMDCAWQKSAYVHIGLHWTALTLGKHSINGGLGPMFIVREDWGQFATYRRGNDFFGNRVMNGWQYRFFPIGGEVEYLYQINDRLQFQYSVIPGYPAVITSKLGLRMKF